jgi:hypothetical protein
MGGSRFCEAMATAKGYDHGGVESLDVRRGLDIMLADDSQSLARAVIMLLGTANCAAAMKRRQRRRRPG